VEIGRRRVHVPGMLRLAFSVGIRWVMAGNRNGQGREGLAARNRFGAAAARRNLPPAEVMFTGGERRTVCVPVQRSYRIRVDPQVAVHEGYRLALGS
jgi:hypothetical protein